MTNDETNIPVFPVDESTWFLTQRVKSCFHIIFFAILFPMFFVLGDVYSPCFPKVVKKQRAVVFMFFLFVKRQFIFMFVRGTKLGN